MDASRITQDRLVLRRERVELGYVHGDATRLAQVFSNLLNNAAQYTPTGGRIFLTVQPNREAVVIRVKDTGIGIPAAFRDQIFEMFVQVDHSLERSRGGLGIGLTLVKRLVEMHGGTVHVQSQGEGRGSEFVVTLPMIATPAMVQPPEVRGRIVPVLGQRVLVADDNDDAAETLAMMLRLSGNDVRTAQDGVAAIQAAAQFRPDGILLDIGMPKLNGYEAARRIRQSDWGKQITLVAVTGWGQEQDKQRSKDAGFDYHLVKPVDPADLERILTSLHESTGRDSIPAVPDVGMPPWDRTPI